MSMYVLFCYMLYAIVKDVSCIWYHCLFCIVDWVKWWKCWKL